MAVERRSTYDRSVPCTTSCIRRTDKAQRAATYIREKHRSQFGKQIVPEIHLFVPRDLLDCGIEMVPFGRIGSVLGSDYPFVIRTNTIIHQTSKWYDNDLEEKWAHIEMASDQNISEIFEFVRLPVIS